MGNAKRLAVVLASLPLACGRGQPELDRGGSLFLMNQTHDDVDVALYRAPDVDCVEVARDASAALPRAPLAFERCVALAPAELVELDREDAWKEVLPCEAIALKGPALGPHGVFWTDTDTSRDDNDPAADLIEIVSVNRSLVLDPPADALIVPLAFLPEHPCGWTR
jgi:hypothetical protein